jgi:hypothetical protein
VARRSRLLKKYGVESPIVIEISFSKSSDRNQMREKKREIREKDKRLKTKDKRQKIKDKRK